MLHGKFMIISCIINFKSCIVFRSSTLIIASGRQLLELAFGSTRHGFVAFWKDTMVVLKS